MADWTQIIVAVIGSSLVGFLLTNGIIDYNNPIIRLYVDETSGNSTQKRYDTTIINEGLSAATNLRVTLHYPSGNISHYRLVLEGENTTAYIDPERQSSLVIEVPRFAKFGDLLVHTIVNDTKIPHFKSSNRTEITYNATEARNTTKTTNYSNFKGSYFILATYDQGGAQLSTANSTQPAYRYLEENRIPFSLLIVLIVVFALIVLTSVILYRIFIAKGFPKIKIPYLVAIGLIDSFVIIAILYSAIPNQLGLYGSSIFIPLVIVLMGALAYLIYKILTSAPKSRKETHFGKQPIR